MKLFTLVLCEIRHRTGSFLLTVLSVAVAVAAFVCSSYLLRADQLETDALLAKRQQDVEKAGAQLEDSMRKITKGLGFNILVLPKEQDLSELHAEGTPTSSMPETYVDKLTSSKIVTVNHLLPIVAKKVAWPEMNRSVILTGTRGEVPLAHRALKKPLQDAVPKGTMIVGANLQHKKDGAALGVGDTIKLMDREFQVTKVHEERGTADDITVWINLTEAQEMLGMQNLVNAILALECNCATEDRVAEIREEIAGILPGTQIIERGPPALARAEARNRAKAAAVENLEAAETSRKSIQDQRAGLASVLVPLIVVIAASWIVLLTILNIRQRRSEIGILRAIGLGSGQILQVLLGKAVIAGLCGGLIGFGLGFCAGRGFGASTSSAGFGTQTAGLMLAAFVAAPLLSVVAGWLPAILAAKTDPATILSGS